MGVVANTVEKLLLAAPRGYCAGVDRAVQTVERALDLHGPPVYVRKQIVHNKHVVELLAARGAVFVEDVGESPRERSPCSPPTASPRGAQRAPCTQPRHDRRHLPARHEGPPRGRRFAKRWLHDRAGRPRRPRGGRRARWARPPSTSCSSRASRTSRRSWSRIPSGSPTSRRRRSPSTRRARSSSVCASASRRSSGRAPTTSATPPPTARRPSSRWRATAT